MIGQILLKISVNEQRSQVLNIFYTYHEVNKGRLFLKIFKQKLDCKKSNYYPFSIYDG